MISFDNVNEKELNKEFISKLENLLINKTSKENLDEIIKLLNDCLIVDWYKREPTRSKIKRNLIKYSKSHEDSLNKEAVNILVNESMMIMNELIKKHMLKKRMVIKMSIVFTEASYENSVIELFKNINYEYVYGPDIERDFYSPFYESELENSLTRINKGQSYSAIKEAINKLKNIENGSLIQKK